MSATKAKVYSYPQATNTAPCATISGTSITFPTFDDGYHEGPQSFKVHVRFAGHTETEAVLEARINDNDGLTIVNNSYDAFDHLVRRRDNVEQTQWPYMPNDTVFTYQDGQVVLAFEVFGTQTQRFLWGPHTDQLLATEYAPSYYGGGHVYFPLADAQGTIHDAAKFFLADAQAQTYVTQVVMHRDIDAYGRDLGLLTFAGPDYGAGSTTHSYAGPLFVFTGRYTDPLTGLQNNHHRWYAPELGRWMSEDPAGFGPDFNPYRYVHNSVTNFTDPSGLQDFGQSDLSNTSPEFGKGVIEGLLDVGMPLASIFFEPLDWALTAKGIHDEPRNPWSYAGVLPFVPAAVGKGGKLFGKGARQAGKIAKELTEGVAENCPDAKKLIVDADRFPEAARHLEESGATGKPLTVNRKSAAQNRRDALQGKDKVAGYDLDESPPAVLRQPGDPVSVRPIPPGDNRGAGGSIGRQLQGVPNGGKVIILIPRKGGG